MGKLFLRRPLVAVARQGRRVQFVAVLEPVQDGHSPGVTAVDVKQVSGATQITVAREETSDVINVTNEHFAN
ncbi:MAG: hypothetical protein GXY83_04385 [Rhodopirellula sp.]|nr:hypothetical protein [Rhodopirellula sp.]